MKQKEIKASVITRNHLKGLNDVVLCENIELNKNGGYPETDKRLVTKEVLYPPFSDYLKRHYRIVL